MNAFVTYSSIRRYNPAMVCAGFFFMVIFLLQPSVIFAQSGSARNVAFQRGEKLVYKIYYHSILTGSMVAGEALLEVTPENKQMSGRNTYHIKAFGRTRGAFNFFYKVVDRFESFVDEETLLPYLFLRRIYEDGYERDEDNIFDQKNHLAYFKDNRKGTTEKIEIPANLHDILSAIYYLRNVDFENTGNQDHISIQYMFSDSVYTSEIKLAGSGVANIGIGRVNCMKVQPRVLTGNVFGESYPLTIWVSDDKNRLPVYAQSNILVGSVRMELVSWKNLRNPFSSLRKK
jgi:hypothetical protein